MQVLLFLHILSSVYGPLSFHLGHSDLYEVESVLICISLITKDAEYFFRCFRAIRVPQLRILFSSVPHLLIGLFDSLEATY